MRNEDAAMKAVFWGTLVMGLAFLAGCACLVRNFHY